MEQPVCYEPNSGRNAPSRLVLALIFLAALPADAQVYKWKDADGRTVISDVAPGGPGVKQIGKNPEASSPKTAPAKTAGGKTDANPQTAAEKEQADRAAEEKRKAQAEYCGAARERLAQLQAGERILQIDKSGERSFMSDQQRNDEMNRLRAGMAEQKCP